MIFKINLYLVKTEVETAIIVLHGSSKHVF